MQNQPDASGFIDVGAGFTGGGMGATSMLPPQIRTAQNVMQPQQAPKPQEAGWKKLLPTIGSIAIPAIAVALAPETGGASLLAASALSGLGAGGGKALENVLTGQDVSKGVGQEALTTGGTSLLTGGLAKGAGKFLGKAAPALESTTSKLAQGQLEGTLPKREADYFTKQGVYDLKKFAKTALPEIGGSEGAFNKAVYGSLGERSAAGQTIRLSDFGSTGKTIAKGIEDAAAAAGVASDTPELRNVNKLVQGYLGKYVNKIPNTNLLDPTELAKMNLTDAFNFTKDLDKIGIKFIKSGSATKQLQGEALLNTSDLVKETLYGTKTAIGQNSISDTVRNNLLKDLQAFKTKYPQYKDYIDSKLAIAQNPNATIADLRSAHFPETQLSKSMQKLESSTARPGKGISAADVSLPIMTGVSAGPVAGIGTLAATKALESEPGQILATKVFGKAAKALASEKLPSILARMGAIGGGALGTVPGWVGQGNLAPVGGATTMQQQGMGGGMGAGMQPSAPPISQLYNTLYGQYLAGGPAATGASNLPSVLAGLAPQAQLTGELNKLTGGLGASYLGAGGPQGLVGGLGALATGFIPGTPANLYQRQQAGVASLLQSLYGIPTGVGQGLMPQFTQAPGTAGIAAGNVGL